MSENEVDALFFICDISGYTAYMLKNQTDYTHGALLINQLLDALIKEIDLPMKVSKIEGDAIFFFSHKKISEETNPPAILGEKILHFFNVFYSKLQEMQNSTDCKCGACSNIDKLDLKMVVHFGKAGIVQIGSFEELCGVDVIIVHRLLKNKVNGHLYVLVTEAASKHVQFPPELKCELAKEEVADVGPMSVRVYFPVSKKDSFEKVTPSRLTLLKTHLELFWGGLLLKLHLKKTPHFHNFPHSEHQVNENEKAS